MHTGLCSPAGALALVLTAAALDRPRPPPPLQCAGPVLVPLSAPGWVQLVTASIEHRPPSRHVGLRGDQFPLLVNRVFVRWHQAGGCCSWWLHLHEHQQRRLVDPGNLRRLPRLEVNRVLVRRHQAGGWCLEWLHLHTTDTTRSWKSIASSSDGTKLAAGVWNGYIYTSIDSGATWTQATSDAPRRWRSIATSFDGIKLAAVANGGYIYTSTNSGATWTQATSAGSRDWKSIASSSDGCRILPAVGCVIQIGNDAIIMMLVTLQVYNAYISFADKGI